MTAIHCLRGHDISVVGRSKQRMCRTCLRAWDRERNQRRRQDPAYRELEAQRSIDYSTWRRPIIRAGHAERSAQAQLAELGVT